MSRLKNIEKEKKVFVGFLTGGDPTLEKTEEYAILLAKSGVDIIEIGIPFMDPIADGEVIQRASLRALKNGTNLGKIFEVVLNIRKKFSFPIVFLSYLNSILKYGYDEFFKTCNNIGVDGVVIPDLPFEERGQIESFARENDVDIISLIAPTSDDRITKIAKNSTGFLYVVSSMGVTGERDSINTDIKSIVSKIRSVTDTPALVGFGIKTPEQARMISEISDGVIIGSAIVKIIEEKKEDAEDELKNYIKSIKDSINCKK